MICQENIQKLRALVGEVAGQDISELEINHDLADFLGMDSLEILELLLAVENNFDVQFPDDALSKLKTLQDLLDVLETRLQERES
jgi:acyl carrier protein